MFSLHNIFQRYFKFISIITFVIVLIFSFSVYAETLPIVGECSDLNSTNLSTQMAYEIDSRINGLTASDSTQMLWSSRGNGTEGWVRSSTVWTENGTTPLDFTGASPWNSVVPNPPTSILGEYKGAGTLISPRHIVFAHHYQIPNGSTVIFVDNSNNIISRTIVNQMQVASSDIQIAVLDSDVPSSITYYPIVDLASLQNYWKTVPNTPIIILDQEDKALIKEASGVSSGNFGYNISSSSPRSDFNETLIAGDSGNPIFAVIGGRLVLFSSVYFADMGPFFSSYVNEINSVMTSLGGGYQVSTLDLSCFVPQSIPVFSVESTTFLVNENSPIGTEIGSVLATGSGAFAYSFTSGNTNNVFAVNANTGSITVNNQSFLNYESIPSYTLTLKAQNAASWYWPITPDTITTTVIINLADVNESPSFGFTSLETNLEEDSPASVSVVSVALMSATDPDIGQTISYSILSGNTNNAFTISPTTGEITVTDSDSLDYDIHNSYHLIVEASDNGTPSLSVTASVTINIYKGNRPTVSFESSSSTHDENSGIVSIPIVLSHTYTKDISLTLNTVNGSALLNTDFTLSTNTVFIPKGQLTGTFPVRIIYSTTNDSDKIFTINIASASKANFTTPSTHSFTIKNVYHSTSSLSGGGGNSGGGGTYVPPVIPSVTPAPTTEVVSGCSGGNLYNTSAGALCVNNVGPQIPGCDNRTTGFSITTGTSCIGNTNTTTVITTPTTITTYNFGTTTLKNGSKGEAVKELQRFLNKVLNLYLVVDGNLGLKTIVVIKKWQKDNGLVADSLVGAKTKAKMNASVQI